MPLSELRQLSPRAMWLSAIGLFIIIVLAFGAGVAVGNNKARYSHGTMGTIADVNLPTMTVRDRNRPGGQTVILASTTVVRSLRGTENPSDLMPGDTVIVIGSPDIDGRIHAVYVRVISPAPSRSLQPYVR